MDGRRQRVPRANVMEYDARRLMTSTSTSTTPPPSPTPRSLEGVTNMPGQTGGSSGGSVRHGSMGGTQLEFERPEAAETRAVARDEKGSVEISSSASSMLVILSI